MAIGPIDTKAELGAIYAELGPEIKAALEAVEPELMSTEWTYLHGLLAYSNRVMREYLGENFHTAYVQSGGGKPNDDTKPSPPE